MKPYTPPTRIGRSKATNDIHHKTSGMGRGWRHSVAKAMRHATRFRARVEMLKAWLEESA